MPDDLSHTDSVHLNGRRASNPAGQAEARGRFFDSRDTFARQLSPVPARAFTAEPALALNAETPTGLIPCDVSTELGMRVPATTPLLIAYYAKIRQGETLVTDFTAGGAIVYVIRGGGTTICANETIAWSAGDIFALPGGDAANHIAVREDSVLWMVTNEPQFAFDGARAPAKGKAPTELVHFGAAEIARQLSLAQASGSALVFSSDRQEDRRNILPTITLAINPQAPGTIQPPHSHNAAAISLVIEADGGFTEIDGHAIDWSPWVTLLTPPCAIHSHHNTGARPALLLIAQDGGLYSHARAMGFSWGEALWGRGGVDQPYPESLRAPGYGRKPA